MRAHKVSLLVAMATLFVVVASFCLVGCPPSPVNPPRDADADIVVVVADAGLTGLDGFVVNPYVDGSTFNLCATACQTLRGIPCSEGSEDAGQGCTAVCVHTLGGQFDLKPLCIVQHPTRDGVRACGTVKCL